MAHATLGADMAQLVRAVKLAVEYSSTVLAAQYRKGLLRDANVLAVDSRSLLDAVDTARRRRIWTEQKATGGDGEQRDSMERDDMQRDVMQRDSMQRDNMQRDAVQCNVEDEAESDEEPCDRTQQDFVLKDEEDRG